MAAKLAGVPVVIHESDVTPGLANKIALPFASHILRFLKKPCSIYRKKRQHAQVPLFAKSYLWEIEQKGYHYVALQH